MYKISEQTHREKYMINLNVPSYSGETINLEIERFWYDDCDEDEQPHWSQFYVKITRSPFDEEYTKDMLKAITKAITYCEAQSKKRKE